MYNEQAVRVRKEELRTIAMTTHNNKPAKHVFCLPANNAYDIITGISIGSIEPSVTRITLVDKNGWEYGSQTRRLIRISKEKPYKFPVNTIIDKTTSIDYSSHKPYDLINYDVCNDYTYKHCSTICRMPMCNFCTICVTFSAAHRSILHNPLRYVKKYSWQSSTNTQYEKFLIGKNTWGVKSSFEKAAAILRQIDEDLRIGLSNRFVKLQYAEVYNDTGHPMLFAKFISKKS